MEQQPGRKLSRREQARLEDFQRLSGQMRQQGYRRVDLMMEQGLLEEVRALRERGVRKDSTAMQGLGYKELYAYLDGEYPLDEAVRIIKRDTRHFAKRQITWFKREKNVVWADRSVIGQDDEKLADYMLDCLRDRKII